MNVPEMECMPLDRHTRLWVQVAHTNPLAFESEVLDRAEGRVLLTLSEGNWDDTSLVEGTPVLLLLKTEDREPLRFEATVMFFQDAPITGLWVKLTHADEDPYRHQRRHVRLKAHFPVQVFTNVFHHDTGILAQSVDLSGGGLRFIAEQDFQPTDRLWVQFQPHPKFPMFELACEVVNSTPLTQGHVPQYDIGVKFIDIHPRIEDRLVGFCFFYEMEQQRQA